MQRGLDLTAFVSEACLAWTDEHGGWPETPRVKDQDWLQLLTMGRKCRRKCWKVRPLKKGLIYRRRVYGKSKSTHWDSFNNWEERRLQNILKACIIWDGKVEAKTVMLLLWLPPETTVKDTAKVVSTEIDPKTNLKGKKVVPLVVMCHSGDYRYLWRYRNSAPF